MENIWPNKIEYSISTPTKAVIFGTNIQIDFRLIPLLKGLRVGQIVSQLVETHDLTLNPDDPESFRNSYKNTRTIATDEHELDGENGLEIIDESAEGYQFTRDLALPKSLTKCLQDTDTRGIRIRHKLKFRIQLHNPDGHISEVCRSSRDHRRNPYSLDFQLRATLPVSVFISPNLPIDDENNLVDQTPHSARRAVDDLAQQAPPLYGEHQFDQLYGDVDPSGYRTPGLTSGPTTPFGTLSRNLSAENLASMNAVTTTDISASALHSRLSSLRNNRMSYNSPMDHENHPEIRLGVPTDYFGPSSGSTSHTPASPVLSRRPSDEGEHEHDREHEHVPSGMATPFQPHSAELELLSRVPSYDTAMRSNTRSNVRVGDAGLPDYISAVGSENHTPTPPQSPQRAYVRDSNRGSDQNLPTLDVPRRPSLFQSRSTGNMDDEGNRVFQARA